MRLVNGSHRIRDLCDPKSQRPAKRRRQLNAVLMEGPVHLGVGKTERAITGRSHRFNQLRQKQWVFAQSLRVDSDSQ
jgi:hypothetical protein